MADDADKPKPSEPENDCLEEQTDQGPEPESKKEHVKKTWTTAMNHTAKFKTYGGFRGQYRESNMKRNDNSFWHSRKWTGRRGVKVTFEKPVTITSFRVKTGTIRSSDRSYRKVGLHVNGVKKAITPSRYKAPKNQFFDMLEFKESNASFSGREFDLRWNVNDYSSYKRFAQVAFIEIDYFECEDCTPYKDCKPSEPASKRSVSGKPFKLAVYSGLNGVYAISVNDKKYGEEKGIKRKLKTASDEYITKIKYGLVDDSGKDRLCELLFFSNRNKKYGPYGSARSTKGYYEVNEISDLSKLIKLNGDRIGFSGAYQYAKPGDCVKEFSVHAGGIVDAITVNGMKYGRDGGKTTKIKLRPDEKITKVKYRRIRHNRHECMGQLMFYTNKRRKFGPYGEFWRGPPREANLPCDWGKTITLSPSYPMGFAGTSRDARRYC